MKNYQLIFLLFLFFLIHPTLAAETPAVIISEIAWMGTTTSSNDEWIELYNQTDTDIDVTGWKIAAHDGAPSITLSGVIKTKAFYILERTDDQTLPSITADQIYSGSLSNTGEWLQLFNTSNTVIDEINATDNWPGGDNASKLTLERTTDLQWKSSATAAGSPRQISDTTTPPPDPNPEENPDPIISPTATSTPSTTSAQKGSTASGIAQDDVIFNEVLTNPSRDGNFEEFFEIKNISKKTIDITGWQVQTQAGQRHELTSIIMAPESIVYFTRTQTKLTFHNFSEILKLIDRQGKTVTALKITNAPSDQSFSRGTTNRWTWTTPTPGQPNIIVSTPEPPTIITYVPKPIMINEFVEFDASDSFSAYHEPLQFSWAFGDGRIDTGANAKTMYRVAGEYEVTLTVADSRASTTEVFKITVTSPNTTATTSSSTISATSTSPTTTTALTASFAIDQEIPFIFISEFLPDPASKDEENEFIELSSHHHAAYDLGGWQLDDGDGGSKPFTIPAGTIIQPQQHLVFMRPQTKLVLNNDTDAVRLMTPNGRIVDSVQYENISSGYSSIRDDQMQWQQVATPTPGEKNLPDSSGVTQEQKITATTTPQVLGAATEITSLPPQNNTVKYIVASALTCLVIGFFLGSKRKPTRTID